MARVLIIDDNPSILTLLRTFLEHRTPHEVILAEGGKEGMERAVEDPPDLALVDVMMPGIDGYAVVRQLRRDPRTADVGIIILTARGQDVDHEAALQAGADLYLSKPVDMQALADAIETLVGRRNPSSQRTLVLPVLSLKGGIGVTTVATNLAVLLQQVGSTVLWDLSPTSGHAALFLGLEPKIHWGLDLTNSQSDSAPKLLQHRSGLQVLCAPPVPGVFRWLDAESSSALMRQLMTETKFIVIDMPPILDGVTEPLLSEAYRLLLLTGDDPPALQTTLATLKALRKLRSKTLVVYNVRDSNAHFAAEALQRTLRLSHKLQDPVPVDLPYDPYQRAALKRGVPLALARPDSSLTRGLKGLVQRLLIGQT